MWKDKKKPSNSRERFDDEEKVMLKCPMTGLRLPLFMVLLAALTACSRSASPGAPAAALQSAAP